MSGQVNQVGSDPETEDVDRSITALTAYHYNRTTGLGQIDSWGGVPSFVNVGNDIRSSLESLLNGHTSSLPMLFTHSDGASVSNLYHAFTVKFTDYVKVKKNLVVKTYTVPCRAGVNPIRYYYMPNMYRQFFKGIIDLIVQLHRKNVALSTLSLDENFVIHKDVLKLVGLRHIFNCSASDKKNDYALLADALDELFTNKNMPVDVVDLCQCLRDYSKRNDEFFLLNHIALLQSQERMDRIKAFHEKISLIPPTKRQKIFSQMIRVNWTVHFAGQNVNHSPWGPVLQCYYYNRNSSPPSIYHVADVTNFSSLNFQAIRFSRNIAAHILQYMPQYRAKANTEDIELSIMAAFAPQLLSFQKEAHECGVLHLLRI